MKDAISYIRVSSEEQADSGLGLEAQRQRIAAYCTMKGLHLAEVFEDPAISAGKPLASRPAGNRLLAAAKKSKAIVVVAKLDRLFRSVADAANVIADFDKKGIQLVAIAEGFDMTNMYGRAMAQMASVFAELERAMIRERTRSAMSVKRSRGERISGHAPFGSDFGAGGKLVENAREQKIIARMRRLRAEGLSYRGITARIPFHFTSKLYSDASNGSAGTASMGKSRGSITPSSSFAYAAPVPWSVVWLRFSPVLKRSPTQPSGFRPANRRW